ncbi:MAG TPA: DUF3592 domain-containing protein [Polyangiaceae bacterium]|nr:DUF3592 domain-containing protein [Polyangiaceae bacterium]
MMPGIILVSALLPIVIIALVVGGLMRGQQATQRLLTTGTPARGRILQLGTTGGSVAVMGHRHLNLTLTVEVQPQMGAPYTATFQQLISELQIPSVQPGAMVELRIDPTNPQRMAMASVIPAGMATGPYGLPAGNPYGPQPGMGMGVGGVGAPVGVSVMTPQYKSALPMIIGITLVTTIPVVAILGWHFVDFGQFGGGSSSKDESDSESAESDAPAKGKKGGICAQAAACCKVISGDAGSACSNLDNGMMPLDGCKQALDAYKKSAKAMKKTCQ